MEVLDNLHVSIARWKLRVHSNASAGAALVRVNAGVKGMVCHLECRARTAKIGNAAVVTAIISARAATDRRKIVCFAEGIPSADHRNKVENEHRIKEQIKDQNPRNELLGGGDHQTNIDCRHGQKEGKEDSKRVDNARSSLS